MRDLLFCHLLFIVVAYFWESSQHIIQCVSIRVAQAAEINAHVWPGYGKGENSRNKKSGKQNKFRDMLMYGIVNVLFILTYFSKIIACNNNRFELPAVNTWKVVVLQYLEEWLKYSVIFFLDSSKTCSDVKRLDSSLLWIYCFQIISSFCSHNK